jgi:hypothetical protein
MVGFFLQELEPNKTGGLFTISRQQPTNHPLTTGTHWLLGAGMVPLLEQSIDTNYRRIMHGLRSQKVSTPASTTHHETLKYFVTWKASNIGKPIIINKERTYETNKGIF